MFAELLIVHFKKFCHLNLKKYLVPNMPFISLQMELHPGTGVYLSVPQWTAAHQCRTASAFVRAVLVCLFDTETLLKSNFKGGASKRLTDGEKRVQLDPVKTSALTGRHVVSQF